MIFLLKGILLGLICGVPIGAIGALCIQRSLSYGIKSGIITGIGSSVADCFYASVGTFGITLISNFIKEHQKIINIIGGIIIIIMGIIVILKQTKHNVTKKRRPHYTTMFLSSLGIGIVNPAVLIIFMLAFMYLGVDSNQGIFNDIIFIIGVFVGTMIWWIVLSIISDIIRKKYGDKGFEKLNTILGAIMIGFGNLIFIKMYFI